MQSKISPGHGHRWSLDDIQFDQIDAASVHADQFLFVTLASASFVEILAQTYSGNLIAHFRGNAELTAWLEQSWQRDETRHGQALKAYVQTVWPEFDWEQGHQTFRAEYGACCTAEQLEPQRALELMARCVVETGTSTFYRALQDYVHEPVLHDLIGKIGNDEVSHYRFFRRHFDLANAVDGHGGNAAMATVWRRLRAVRGEDAYLAFKHVSKARHRDSVQCEDDWRAYNRKVKQLARDYYPYEMAIGMLIKPLPLSAPLKRLMHWPMVGLARMVL